MNKIKIAMGIIFIAVIASACGNGSAKTQSVKLVSVPNVVEGSKEVSKDSDKKLDSSKETKASDTEKKSNVVQAGKEIEKKETSTTKVSTKKAIPNINYKLKNKTIVIDPGHAKKADTSKEPVAPNSSTLKYKQTGGAQGIITKTPEYKINMDVALKLKGHLEANGFTVIMTRTDNDITMSNIERAKLGNEADAALVIRIHADSSENSSAKGASMLVPASNDYTEGFYSESKLFGQVILNTVTNYVGMNNRGVVERSDMTGFNWSTVPVVLIEMGFLSNNEEDKSLSSSSYQEKIAKSISDGVVLLSK